MTANQIFERRKGKQFGQKKLFGQKKRKAKRTQEKLLYFYPTSAQLSSETKDLESLLFHRMGSNF
jgi:hypothetical protein